MTYWIYTFEYVWSLLFLTDINALFHHDNNDFIEMFMSMAIHFVQHI